MYTGGPALFTIIPNDPLVFSVPNPPGEYPATLFPPTYKCESNVLVGVPTGQIGPPTEFTGCDFYGYLPGSETFTLSVTGGSGIVLALPTDFGCVTPSECHMVNGQDVVDLSPEPATALLYVTGLVLLVGFARKRFGADILA
jgi:hypothetical protein